MELGRLERLSCHGPGNAKTEVCQGNIAEVYKVCIVCCEVMSAMYLISMLALLSYQLPIFLLLSSVSWTVISFPLTCHFSNCSSVIAFF